MSRFADRVSSAFASLFVVFLTIGLMTSYSVALADDPISPAPPCSPAQQLADPLCCCNSDDSCYGDPFPYGCSDVGGCPGADDCEDCTCLTYGGEYGDECFCGTV